MDTALLLATLVLAAVCAWGFAYILVNLSVISLRLRRPDLPRPYRTPFFPIPQIAQMCKNQRVPRSTSNARPCSS